MANNKLLLFNLNLNYNILGKIYKFRREGHKVKGCWFVHC